MAEDYYVHYAGSSEFADIHPCYEQGFHYLLGDKTIIDLNSESI